MRKPVVLALGLGLMMVSAGMAQSRSASQDQDRLQDQDRAQDGLQDRLRDLARQMLRDGCQLDDDADLEDIAISLGALDPGPAPQGTAIAEYNPLTGEFIVSVAGVMSWNLQSDGLFTETGLLGVQDILPLGEGFTLVSANPSTVGEGAFGSQMTYTDINLGALVPPGLDVSAFTLEYVAGFGSPKEFGEIRVVQVIPEPGTVLMLLSGLIGLAICWRRRTRA